MGSDTAAPTTGATDEQIEAALDRWSALVGLTGDGWLRGERRNQVRALAEILVQPGYVIAKSGDVLTSEQRAAIGVLVQFFDAYAAFVMHGDRESEEAGKLWAERVQLGVQAMELRPILASLAGTEAGS